MLSISDVVIHTLIIIFFGILFSSDFLSEPRTSNTFSSGPLLLFTIFQIGRKRSVFFSADTRLMAALRSIFPYY